MATALATRIERASGTSSSTALVKVRTTPASLPGAAIGPSRAVTLAGLVLRLYCLGAKNLWLDEMWSVVVARMPLQSVLWTARTQDPNSANSQFFIVLDEASHLTGMYTVVGEVVAGMAVVDKIKKGPEAQNGAVADPDVMLKVQVAADVK